MLIHTHIPKTGGTTFDRILTDHFSPEARFRDWPNWTPDIPDFPPSASIISGHFKATKYAGLFIGAVMATWVRDPVERLVSAYQWLRRHVNDPDIADDPIAQGVRTGDLSLEEYAETKHSSIAAQFDGMSPREFDFVGVLEDWKRCMDVFAARFLDGADYVVTFERKNLARRGRTYKISAQERRTIEALYAEDIDIYREVKALWAAGHYETKPVNAINASEERRGTKTFDLVARADELRISVPTIMETINKRPWFHQCRLDADLHTPGIDNGHTKLAALGIPDITGKTVIDIGAVDGYFSFAAEALGAARVLATDHHAWHIDWLDGKGNFLMMRDLYASGVEMMDIPVEHLSPETVGVFDVTLFLGVLYHTEMPLQYLRILRSITGEVAIVESLADLVSVKRPAAAYYPGATLNEDSSNVWGPNPAAIEAMLYEAGFARVEYKGLWTSPVVMRRGVYLTERTDPPDSGRAIFHAWV